MDSGAAQDIYKQPGGMNPQEEAKTPPLLDTDFISCTIRPLCYNTDEIPPSSNYGWGLFEKFWLVNAIP